MNITSHPYAYRDLRFALGTFLMLSCSFQFATAQILLDDHFDDGDIATGGTNGGFVEVGNTREADVEISESGSVATIEIFSVQTDPNKGIVSVENLDLAGAGGFRATFVVDEVSDNRCCNGHFLGIADDNESFFRSIKNFGFAFFGHAARTDSNDGFGLVINDIGSPGAETILASDDLDLDSYLDGFTASFTADPDGWSYEISDVDNFDGDPETFSDSGDWASAGLADSFYQDFFDDDEYVFVSSQINNGDQIHSYDRITVESLGATGGVAGDFNNNGMRDPADLDLLAEAMRANDVSFDLTDDGQTTIDDRTFWVADLTNTSYGDSNFNGEFNSSDFVKVFSSAKYETGDSATWEEGDWNGDGLFNSSDFVLAFADGTYEKGPRPGGLQTVPEPNGVVLAVFALCLIARRSIRH